jgi:hypothetical protein
MVREEVYATALERRVIPSDYTYSPGLAYKWSLMHTVTSLTKGWFAQFCAENIGELFLADVDYVSIHRNNSDKLILL